MKNGIVILSLVLGSFFVGSKYVHARPIHPARTVVTKSVTVVLSRRPLRNILRNTKRFLKRTVRLHAASRGLTSQNLHWQKQSRFSKV